MSKEKTQEQKDGFAFGVFAMSLFHIGIKLMEEPNWLTYLGFSMILFSIAMAWKFAKPSKKTIDDHVIETAKKRKENE